MKRQLGYGSLLLAAGCWLGAVAVRSTTTFEGLTISSFPADAVLVRVLLVGGVAFAAYGSYLLALRLVLRTENKRRAHDLRNVLRLLFGAVAVVTALGALTEQWLGVLLSLGVVGFAVTFALQQPLLSLIAWFYIMLKRPYTVGDRVQIGEARGDVIEVDFLVTTLWEINGPLVSSNQPSGRVVTVPNSTVLAAEVSNYGGEFPFVWNELSVQVAYETDLAFARERMVAVADDYLGDDMERAIGRYRERLSETPVELEVNERPAVNVVLGESWVELRLRYLVHPRRGTRVRNALYERVLEEFGEHPDRVGFPIGRNR